MMASVEITVSTGTKGKITVLKMTGYVYPPREIETTMNLLADAVGEINRALVTERESLPPGSES
jgi:hypothetical protein